jgi:hypothetical protein
MKKNDQTLIISEPTIISSNPSINSAKYSLRNRNNQKITPNNNKSFNRDHFLSNKNEAYQNNDYRVPVENARSNNANFYELQSKFLPKYDQNLVMHP